MSWTWPASNRRIRCFFNLLGQGRQLKELPDPRFLRRSGQLQQLREVAPHLLPHLIGQAIEILTEILFQTRNLAQPDHDWVIQTYLAETMLVCP